MFYFPVECQTDMNCDSVTIISLQREVTILKLTLTRRPEFCVESVLKENDKLTRFTRECQLMIHS